MFENVNIWEQHQEMQMGFMMKLEG